MKKSLIYQKLQYIVLNEDLLFDNTEKLEVLRELFAQEDLAKFAEEQEAEVKGE